MEEMTEFAAISAAERANSDDLGLPLTHKFHHQCKYGAFSDAGEKFLIMKIGVWDLKSRYQTSFEIFNSLLVHSVHLLSDAETKPESKRVRN